MTKLIAVLLIVGAVFVMACEYQAPPGGVDSYCWRVEQARHEAEGRSVVLYTNVEPERRGSSVTIEAAWFTFHNLGRGPSDRYDRFAEELVLSDALGGIVVEKRCEPSDD